MGTRGRAADPRVAVVATLERDACWKGARNASKPIPTAFRLACLGQRLQAALPVGWALACVAGKVIGPDPPKILPMWQVAVLY